MKGVHTMAQNIALHMNLVDRYHKIAFTDQYIWGFEYKGNIYMATTDASVLPFVTCLDKASRGCGYALRFCPKTAQKLTLMAGAELLCSKKYMEEVQATTTFIGKNGKEKTYNMGEIFEKLVTEHFGQTWEKDRVPFTQDGDLTVDNIAYQIKFQKATFCNEKTLANQEALANQ